MKGAASWNLCMLLVLMAIVSLINVVVDASQHQRTTYQGHKVLHFVPQNRTEHELVANLAKKHSLDVWAAAPSWIDICFSPLMLHHAEKVGVTFEVMIENLQQLIDAESQTVQQAADEPFFNTYRKLDEFNRFLDDLTTSYPQLVSKKTIGRTVEGRAINGITITSKTKPSAQKIGIVYNGGQHAREWISPMTNAWIANELLTRYGKDDSITRFVDEIEWTIIPVVNGDGYVYSWDSDRMWRKNRRRNEGSWFGCVGVDTNRNWDFHWNEGGSSSNTCADDFMGPSPFSEPEEVAVAEYIKAQGNVKGYIDFHAYSQLWMTPWGYTTAKPQDYSLQLAAAQVCVQALTAVYGTAYQYGPIATTIYPASGSSADWVYGVTNVTISFAVELRDTGKYGFLLPASEIVPTGQETMAAVEAMAEFILANKNKL